MPDAARAEGAGGRGIVTICLMTATLMQTLDTTVANVALPYMQGSLSASYDQITWVLTSYVVMAAIMTAPVGWLAARFGRKALFITCMAGFTITSMLCGFADSLVQMVLFRLLQGAFGAALAPLSQSFMLDMYPPEKRGGAMAMWSMGVMVGPILGPTLGGYLTYDFNWRFVFFVNVPFGIAATAVAVLFMQGDRESGAQRFDWTGFTILSVGLAALQVALDRGEELDWLNSSTIVTCLVLAGLGFYLFVVHMFTARTPFIARALFADANYVGGLATAFAVGVVLLSSSTLLAPFLENLGNYPVETAGLLMAPRGLGTMLTMQVTGRLVNKIDPRLMMFFGYAVLMLSLWIQMGWTPDVSQAEMIFTIFLQGAGLGCVFVPLQVVAFYTMPTALLTQGTALLSLVRNVGMAIGLAVTSAMLNHMTQYAHAMLAGPITPFFRPLQAGGAMSRMLDPTTRAGAAMLDSLVQTQAQVIAYIDDYKFMLFATIPAMASLLLMRRPRRQPDAVPAE